VLLHCPKTKEDCDWPSEERRRRRRRLAAARARQAKAAANRRRRRGERSDAHERAGRPAGAARSEGGGGGGRKERRDGLRTSERPLKEKPITRGKHTDRIGKEPKEKKGVEFMFVLIVSFSAN